MYALQRGHGRVHSVPTATCQHINGATCARRHGQQLTDLAGVVAERVAVVEASETPVAAVAVVAVVALVLVPALVLTLALALVAAADTEAARVEGVIGAAV